MLSLSRRGDAVVFCCGECSPRREESGVDPIITHSSIDVGVECAAASRSAAESAANSSPHVVWNPGNTEAQRLQSRVPKTVIIHQAPQTAAAA